MRLSILRAVAALLAAAAILPASGAAQERSSFLLGVLPDTQFYSRYSIASSGDLFMARFGSEPYIEQTKWLAANQDELKIPFVTHLGDIIDRATQNAEWEVADEAMKPLEQAGLPYSILAGNHDVTGNPATEPFPRYFPPSRAAAQATFGGRDATGMHEWHTFTAEGRTFLVLALSWQPDDAAIRWAKDVLAANPTLPAILTTHDILGIASDGVTAVEGAAARRLWNDLIKDNDQIFLTINGHNHGAAHQRKTNAYGNSVDQIVWDYQMAYNGGNGYLGLLEFDFTADRIRSAVVSPWIRLKPVDTIVPEYDQAVRTEPGANLDLPIDFDERFARFQSPPAPVAPSNGDLLAAAKAKVLEGYEEPDVTLPRPPLDESDYPAVAGTVAHWRFAAGEARARDVAGGADMRPAGEVTISADHHALSSNGASACFSGDDGFLNTALDAAVNAHTFPDGYTIESFIKIDAGWNAADNQWMGALALEGTRREVPNTIHPGWSWDEPTFVLAISNLREIQWNALAISADGNGYRERTMWSGEVMPDRWMHVAAVNDPATRTSTLYVDGAPVLRNAIDAVGLGSAGKPWRIGSRWLGCVGETRIIDHPTTPDQWLTARRYAPATEDTTVGGTVPATLALTLGAPASFGAFTPGVARTYRASTTATVTSTAADAALTVSEPGHLANGAFSLPSPLRVAFSGSAWSGPVANEQVAIDFEQDIAAGDALRTGTYARTLTFTLSTTTP